MGRRGRALAVVSIALVLASAAQARPLLGVLGNHSRFEAASRQHSTVRLAFLGWGQGLSYGSPFAALLGSLEPIPMIALNTGGPSGREVVTPAQIASGAGDSYLVGLNRAIAEWGKGIYIRPMAEMNNAGNLWSGFTTSGAPKPGHSPSDYRKAFARIYLVLHGGSADAISAKLRSLGMPGIAQDLPSNPFPRLRVVWNPLAGGSPRIAANAPLRYYPGRAFVDVEGVDIYDEGLGDRAPWSGAEDLYKAAVSHGRPFAIPEFGVYGVDDPSFVRHVCTFLKTHPRTEEASFYEGSPHGIFDLAKKPKSAAVYRSCVAPLRAPLPNWAAQSATPVSGAPTATFTLAGQAVGAVAAPLGADGLELNISPFNGVIGSAFWIRRGKSLGPMSVPRGATGVSFQTRPSDSPPTPLVRPRAGTDFHVTWNASGTIVSAWWTRVGKLLARVPVAPGKTSIAMRQGT